MRKPEMTKNTSTPVKPPRRRFGERWKATTDRTATALKPSMSGRYAVSVITFWFFFGAETEEGVMPGPSGERSARMPIWTGT